MKAWSGERWRLVGVVLAVLLFGGAASASAQTVRVKEASANIHEYARASSDVVASVPEGTILTVLQRQGDWYWVLVPADYYGTRRSGYIPVTSVERTSTDSPEPGIAGARQASAAAPPTTMPPPKFIAGIGYGWQLGAPAFSDHVAFHLYQAAGSFDASYSVPNTSALDLTIGAGITSNLTIQIALWKNSSEPVASAVAIVPHPIQPSTRTTTGEGFVTNRDEVDMHLQIGYRVPVARGVDVTIFAGPSLFHLDQELINNFTYRETFPYDTVEIDNYSTSRKSKFVVGGHVGADLTVMVWRFVGIGVGGRYARGTMNLPSAGTGSTQVTVGGGQVSGGLRIRF